MRLFVGVAPPPAVLDDLDAACAPLRPLRDDLRWTNRPAWHITLAFLGEVTDLSLTRLLPRLERAARRHRAVTLSLAGRGRVPQARQGERAVDRGHGRPPRAGRARGLGRRRGPPRPAPCRRTPGAGSSRT